MNYKGYIGTISFSEKDRVFYGKVEGINGLVNFEGRSVDELTKAFHDAIDDYLQYCKSQGIEPHKTYSGLLNIRIGPKTHAIIATLAKQEGVTINSFIRTAIEKQIAAKL